MAEIQFDNENEFTRPIAYNTQPRGMSTLIIKWGLAKDEKTAGYLLLGAAGALLFVAVALPFFAGSGGGQKPLHLPPDAATGIPGR